MTKRPSVVYAIYGRVEYKTGMARHSAYRQVGPSRSKGHPRGIQAILAPGCFTPRVRGSRKGGDSAPEISAERIKAGVAYLASDRLEGRGPGTRGEILATEYIADEFKKAGLKPIGERGTYFQPVPLVRVVTSPKSTLRAVKGETTLDIPCEEGFSGTSQTQKELEEFDAEAIFVGHGITAPEFDWDDYKGMDVKGKVVVLLHQRAALGRPEILRRHGAHLLRPLDLQVRGGRPARGEGVLHHPHAGDGGLPVLRRPAARRRPAQARARPARTGLRRLALPRGGREAPGPVRAARWTARLKEADTKGFKAVLARRQPEGQLPDPRREDSSATMWSAWWKAATRP